MSQLDHYAISLADLIDLSRRDGVTEIEASTCPTRSFNDATSVSEKSACYIHNLTFIKDW